MTRPKGSAIGIRVSGGFGELVRFGLVGLVGVVVGFGIYEAVYRMAVAIDYRETVAWATSYLIGVSIQHFMHRTMVFKGVTTSYWGSLGRTYLIYGTGAALAGYLNFVLVDSTAWNHRIIWLATMGFVSLINYVALKVFAYSKAD